MWTKQSSGATLCAPGDPGPGTEGEKEQDERHSKYLEGKSHFLKPHLWQVSLMNPNTRTPQAQLQAASTNQSVDLQDEMYLLSPS